MLSKPTLGSLHAGNRIPTIGFSNIREGTDEHVVKNTIRFSSIACKRVVNPLVLATLEKSPCTSKKSDDMQCVLTVKFDDASSMMQV